MGIPYQSATRGATARRRKRVALVTTSWPTTEGDPSGHFVRTEARALRDAENEVVVVAPGDAATGTRSFSAGIDVIPVSSWGAFGWPGVLWRVREHPLRSLGAARWVTAAKDALRHAGPFDRIVAHWVVPSAWPVSMSEHAPLELVSHGADVRLLQAMPAAVRERIVRVLIERAERWRFVSAHLRDGLAEGLPSAMAAEVVRLATIDPAPIDVPDVRAEAVHKRALMGPLPFATCVGRLVASKRVDLAIATAAREGLRLVIVGDGPDRDRLERLAKREGALVRFVGLVDRTEALAWMAASDELFFASETEGLSTVLREAEALGVVVRTIH